VRSAPASTKAAGGMERWQRLYAVRSQRIPITDDKVLAD
jgi:hypothetical protein